MIFIVYSHDHNHVNNFFNSLSRNDRIIQVNMISITNIIIIINIIIVITIIVIIIIVIVIITIIIAIITSHRRSAA